MVLLRHKATGSAVMIDTFAALKRRAAALGFQINPLAAAVRQPPSVLFLKRVCKP